MKLTDLTRCYDSEDREGIVPLLDYDDVVEFIRKRDKALIRKAQAVRCPPSFIAYMKKKGV